MIIAIFAYYKIISDELTPSTNSCTGTSPVLELGEIETWSYGMC